jgi:hypothetical protein
MRRANARIGVDDGYSSPRSADALMKGNLNPEGERICPPADSDGRPEPGVSDFRTRTLIHINAQTGESTDTAANPRYLE